VGACAAQDLSDCGHGLADLSAAVAACTANIQSGKLGKDLLADTLLRRAGYYEQLKAFDKAVGDCTAAIAQRPDFSRGYVCRGVMYDETNRLNLAIADYSHALRLNPNDGLAAINRGMALTKNNDFAASILDFNNAIRLVPDGALGWNNRCWSRAIIGKELDAALADCNEAIRLSPAEGSYWNSRGFVRFRMKQYREAIGDYNASIARGHASGSSYYIRGLAKLALGDASGNADIVRGVSLESGIAARFAGYGVSAKR